MTPELALRGALVALWQADADVGALLGDRIYDRVPDGVLFPYASFGPAQALDLEVTCATERVELVQDVHVWSRAVGQVEALRICDVLRSTARAADRAGSLSWSGFVLHSVRVTDIRMVRDPDGLTSHGILTFSAIIDPTA